MEKKISNFENPLTTTNSKFKTLVRNNFHYSPCFWKRSTHVTHTATLKKANLLTTTHEREILFNNATTTGKKRKHCAFDNHSILSLHSVGYFFCTFVLVSSSNHKKNGGPIVRRQNELTD